MDLHSVTHTHTRLTALFLGLPRCAGTRKVKPIWILLKQETASVSGIRWAICKSAPLSRQITTPAPQHSAFYRPDALPATQPTVSKHWRQVNVKVDMVWILLATACNIKPCQYSVLDCLMIEHQHVNTAWKPAPCQLYRRTFVPYA